MTSLVAKFGSHRHCGSGELMIQVCHVISQDHVIKESCYFMSGPKFGGHKHCGSENIMILICHVI